MSMVFEVLLISDVIVISELQLPEIVVSRASHFNVCQLKVFVVKWVIVGQCRPYV
jgi:hypothetical protein